MQCDSPFVKSGKNHKFCSIKCRDKFGYLKYKDEILIAKASFYERNKATINGQKKLYRRERRKDPYIRLVDNLRSRFNKAFKSNYKTGSAISDLGCSIDFLIKYLETQFKPEMTWDNYGKWHVDHIKPLDSFDLTNIDQVKLACNYINLQPMWAKDNLKKGANYDVKEE